MTIESAREMRPGDRFTVEATVLEVNATERAHGVMAVSVLQLRALTVVVLEAFDTTIGSTGVYRDDEKAIASLRAYSLQRLAKYREKRAIAGRGVQRAAPLRGQPAAAE